MKQIKALLLILVLTLPYTIQAADLPTISLEHLYYLHVRARYVGKLRPDEMIDYCLTQKIGGRAFEELYFQLYTIRLELTKLLRVEEVPNTDSRVVTLNKTFDAYSALLREEAQKIQNGIVREGLIASDTLDTIARAQNPR
jgi:hypothetical protein